MMNTGCNKFLGRETLLVVFPRKCGKCNPIFGRPSRDCKSAPYVTERPMTCGTARASYARHRAPPWITASWPPTCWESWADWNLPPLFVMLAVGTVWARVQPLKGREYFAAQAAQSQVAVRVTMLYQPGVTPDLKVTHEGKQYEIEAVLDTDSKGEELVLMCKG